MNTKKKAPPKIVKTVELTAGEQQVLVALLHVAIVQAATQEDADAYNALSEKIMSEKEAAKALQDLGFTIVDKKTGQEVKL